MYMSDIQICLSCDWENGDGNALPKVGQWSFNMKQTERIRWVDVQFHLLTQFALGILRLSIIVKSDKCNCTQICFYCTCVDYWKHWLFSKAYDLSKTNVVFSPPQYNSKWKNIHSPTCLSFKQLKLLLVAK